MNQRVLFGFHAVAVRLKTAPATVSEVHFDAARHDQRMRSFLDRAREAGVRLVESSDARLASLCGSARHQGVVARVAPLPRSHSLDDTLDAVSGMPLLLVLDGVTDPHNLAPACVADGAGAHAGGRAQGPRRRHQRDGCQDGERRRRNGALFHGHQSRADAR